MPALVSPPGQLDGLLPLALGLLGPLDPSPLDVPEDLACREGPGGRFTLRAQAWRLAEGRAECRHVWIRGAAVEIVNTLLLPVSLSPVQKTGPASLSPVQKTGPASLSPVQKTGPASLSPVQKTGPASLSPVQKTGSALPFFVGEYLVTGRQVRLVFVDVQTPGLPPELRRQVAQEVEGIAGDWPPSIPAPPFVTEHSSGRFCHLRPAGDEAPGPLLEAYGQYLRLWARLAQEPAFRQGALDAAALGRYKAESVRHSPGLDYLKRVFGAEWAVRFMNGFLYA
jgi:hypothetical protein